MFGVHLFFFYFNSSQATVCSLYQRMFFSPISVQLFISFCERARALCFQVKFPFKHWQINHCRARAHCISNLCTLVFCIAVFPHVHSRAISVWLAFMPSSSSSYIQIIPSICTFRVPLVSVLQRATHGELYNTNYYERVCVMWWRWQKYLLDDPHTTHANASWASILRIDSSHCKTFVWISFVFFFCLCD